VDYALARDILSGIAQAAWDTSAGGAPLLYDNRQSLRPQIPTTYGRLVMRHVPGDFPTLGSGRVRVEGILFVQLFTPINSGTLTLDGLANAIVAAYQVAAQNSVLMQGIMLRDVGMTELGVDPADREYHQVNVQAGFQYDITN
jgi:hypothetical protein